MYSQTEASPRISYLPFKYLKKTESIGRGIKEQNMGWGS